MSSAVELLAKVRGSRKKAYSACSKDQQALDRAWLLANTGGDKQELVHMVADILSLSPSKHGLAELLMTCVDESVLSPCIQAARSRQALDEPVGASTSGGELDVGVALGLFLDTDLSWHHYHTLTHVWRLSTDSTDKRLPSKNKVYRRCGLQVVATVFHKAWCLCIADVGWCTVQRAPHCWQRSVPCMHYSFP